jgi:DNA polymerase (family 10)
MPVQNTEIADIFNKVADLLDIQAANPFRVAAYRRAARTFSGLAPNAADMVAEGRDLTKLAGIGRELAEKIREIVKTGTLGQLEALEKRLPAGLHDLLRIPGLGPKKVKALYDQLEIGDLASLQHAARSGKIRTLRGFGPKTEANLRAALKKKRWDRPRIPWHAAAKVARALVAYLEADDSVKQICVAGSFRRRQSTVGDLDILVTCRRGSAIMAHFVAYEDVVRVIARGKTKSSVELRGGLQVDLRKLPRVGYGAGLHYFTGSKAHNIAVRKRGRQKGLKINEYGVFDNDARVAGRTEQSLYDQVDLPYIEPELREDRGEIAAADQNELPDLIRLADIRGDLHVHTRETDGQHSLEEMVAAARARGYTYLAISNHSASMTVANGLDARRLAESIDAIEALDRQMGDFKILKSIEVDIRPDGTLDLPDDILQRLDLTIGAVHSAFDLSRQKQTDRILRAMDSPYFGILAHPTGRLLNTRDPYAVDLERLMEAAAARGCFMELNAHPDRLDLKALHCQMARERGVKIAINTDAHSRDSLDHMRLGIGEARRGWLEAEDVINTRPWEALKKMLPGSERG